MDRASLAQLAIEIAQIVYDLEEISIVHADLSPSSIMVSGLGHLAPVCRLIDFDGFSAPGVEDLPRRHEGQFSRPLGTLGYQYPELILKLMRDSTGSDNSIRVESDRFSLAALICQIMVLDTAFTESHRRWELLTNDIIVSRDLDPLKPYFDAKFPEGLDLLTRALLAKTIREIPSPRAWIETLSTIAAG
jgi:serine/threonine protein kinase